MSNAFQLELTQFLLWALSEKPGDLEGISWQVVGLARKNEKRPGYVQTFVPDGWVRNIKGDARLLDTYLSIRIPKEVMQEWGAMRNAPKGQMELLGSGSMVVESEQAPADVEGSPVGVLGGAEGSVSATGPSDGQVERGAE